MCEPRLRISIHGSIRNLGLAAAPADPRLFRHLKLFGPLVETRPLGAAIAERAGLLAALAPRAWLLLQLALAAVEPLGQHRPARSELCKLAFQHADPAPGSPDGLAQPGVFPGQRLDRRLLAPRPAQGLAVIGLGVGQRLRERLFLVFRLPQRPAQAVEGPGAGCRPARTVPGSGPSSAASHSATRNCCSRAGPLSPRPSG